MESAEGDKPVRESERGSLNKRSLRGDRPIDKPDQDRFDFGPFARRIADAVALRPSTPGLVVGVHGAWGTGKTSVLNLIEHFLTHGSERSRVTVIRFNPWWFSDSADGLLRSFFGQIIASLPTTTKALQKVRPALATLAKLLSKVPLGGFEQAAEGVGELLAVGEPSVEDLRRQIDKHVSSQRRRFVILVDDLDRLPREDIYQMFRVVKAVADFPRFTYVMAFDPEIVGKALAHYVPDQGRSYIDKVVQVPFAMPEVERERLDQVLFEGLDRVLQPIDSDRFDKQRWGNTYLGGIRALVRSPRDIARFLDTLSVSYAAMRDEVDAIDFVAMEALRVFVPDVHRAIAGNPVMFGLGFRFQDDPKKDAPWHQAYLDRVAPELVEPVKDLLKRTFPRLSAVWGNIHYKVSDEWRRDRRACSEEGFPLYFRWAIPSDRLTVAELRRLVEGAAEDVRDLLDRYLVGDPMVRLARTRRLIGDLGPHMPSEPTRPSSLPLCRALIDRCDDVAALDNPTTKSDMDLPIQWRLCWLVVRELQRHPPEARAVFMGAACELSPSLGTIVSLLDQLRTEHTGTPRTAPIAEGERLVEMTSLDRWRESVCRRVQDHADKGTVLDLPEASAVLSWWAHVDREACEVWAKLVVQDDSMLLQLLEKKLRFSSSSGMDDRVGREQPYMMLDSFTQLGLDPSALRDRVARLAESASGRTLQASRVFVATVDNPRLDPTRRDPALRKKVE